MFGYVIANMDKLSPDDKTRYKAYYCGLCRALGTRHGRVSRAALNYDMAFLVLLLTAVYGGPAKEGIRRCGVHPVSPHAFCQNAYTDYAADMTVALAYHKARDDWQDDRRPAALLTVRAFAREYKKVAALYPRQCAAMENALFALSAMERKGETNPDVPGNCFGALMGEIFAVDEDEQALALRAFGRALGKLIYIMDACVDRKSDLRKERYNPMSAYPSGETRAILEHLAALCTARYEALNIQPDNLMENILYSGIWTRYEIKHHVKGGKRA
jgi:hypothetical protein